MAGDSTTGRVGITLLRADVVDAYQRELQALASAGCRYVQLDEVPIALYCDLKKCEQMSRQGIDARKMLFEVFPVCM